MIKYLIVLPYVLEELEADKEIELQEKIDYLEKIIEGARLNLIRSIFRFGVGVIFANLLINKILPNMLNIKSYIPSSFFILVTFIFLLMRRYGFIVEERLLNKTLNDLRSQL